MIAAAIVFGQFMARETQPAPSAQAVTLLKPLHGAEPRLLENLASFLTQDHVGPIQLLCGVQRADDPAIATVEELRIRYPNIAIDLVIDSASHGANRKVSNLINMMAKARHPILVLSDSDMVATPDYLSRVLAAPDAPDIGVATCLYFGRGDAGFWSRLGAAGLSYQFLPGAVFGIVLGLARPCMGSTIAMRRDTLDRIGGFARFANVLADDYAIGEAVQALGQKVAVPPTLVTHASTERNFHELWRHELRWGATVRGVAHRAYIESVIGMPFPLARLGAALVPAYMVGLAIALVSLLIRVIIVLAINHRTGGPAMSLWLLPVRDCLTFAIFVASFLPHRLIGADNGLKWRMTAASASLEIPA